MYLLYPEKQNSKYDNSIPHWKSNVIRESYHLKSNENIDGKWIQFFEDDTTKPAIIFTLLNEKAESKYISYYLNGRIEKIADYKSGYMNGLSVRWYKNGQIKDSAIYRWDTAQIYETTIFKSAYYDNGNRRKVETYDTNGVRNGIWTEYYENGQIKIKQQFTSLENSGYQRIFGKRIGDYTFYYKNGQVRFSIKYDNGKFVDGIFWEYYDDGSKKQSGELKNELRDGEWIEWHENGDLKSKGNYKSGSYIFCGRTPFTAFYEYKTGTWKYYYIGEKLMASGIYKNTTTNIHTNCQGGADVYCGVLNKSWIFLDITESKLNLKQFIQQKLLKDKEVILKRVFKPE